MSPHPQITVVGAGLGGRTLACVVHRNGIQAAVYDLEASPAARNQGGMLDMHEESGQAALRAAGLYQEFRAIVHPGGEAMRILDKQAVVRMEEEDDGDGTRPEVDRGQLRDLLLTGLPEGTVRWGAKVTGAHLMSPFAGEGANLAMFDGAELAAAIAAHPGDIEAALTVYEQALFPRGEAAAADSAVSLEELFRPDAPQGLLDQFAQHRDQAQ